MLSSLRYVEGGNAESPEEQDPCSRWVEHDWVSSTRRVLTKRHRFLVLVMDGARVLGAEARVDFCVFQWEVVEA